MIFSGTLAGLCVSVSLGGSLERDWAMRDRELCSSSLSEKNTQGKKQKARGWYLFSVKLTFWVSGFLLSWRNCFTFPDCVYLLRSAHQIPGTKQNEWQQKSMWMMRDGSPTCWSGVWVVTFFEYVIPSYLKLKNSQVFGKEQKHVSNWVLERGLPKVTLVKEITSSPSYTMYFWWHCSWCGQWLYHPVMTSCTCPSFCYQNASALQQGLEWDISHLWWDLTPQYSVSRNNWPIATVCAHGIRGSSMLESTGQSLFFSRHLKLKFHSQLLCFYLKQSHSAVPELPGRIWRWWFPQPPSASFEFIKHYGRRISRTSKSTFSCQHSLSFWYSHSKDRETEYP